MPHDHDHGSELDDMTAQVMALEKLLADKGIIEPEALDRIIETYETQVGPHRGADVVARAWTDPEFRDWLERDSTAAIHALGYTGRQGEHVTAVFNSETQHNMVVCTLCSCYPWALLGLPPVWYKSAPYRSRAVSEPRAVLREFGVTLPESVSLRVWDSTSEMRYLVIPVRPVGTDGMSLQELAQLVTRDSMIGTALIAAPHQAPDALT